MLRMKLYASEHVDNDGTITVEYHGPEVCLEHSLISMSLWESKYKKPFMLKEPKSISETIDYIDMMIVSQDTEVDFVSHMTEHHVRHINDYISSSPTATWFPERKSKEPPSTEIVTSEVIYYWMFSYGIDKACERWHLQRLLTLIQVFDAKNRKPEKMSREEVIARNKALNAQRKAKLKTKG